jgi:hypothetical protein
VKKLIGAGLGSRVSQVRLARSGPLDLAFFVELVFVEGAADDTGGESVELWETQRSLTDLRRSIGLGFFRTVRSVTGASRLSRLRQHCHLTCSYAMHGAAMTQYAYALSVY